MKSITPKEFRRIFTSFLLGLLLLCPASLHASETVDKTNWPSHLRFLTGPNGGQWFMMGEPIAEILTNNVLPASSRMGGGVSNLKAINDKMGDLGFSLACFLGAAQSGEPEYQNMVMENTVLMANIYPQVLYVLVRKDFAKQHNIIDVQSLLQKNLPLRFATLKEGTASEFILSMLLKYGYNTDYAKLRSQGWQVSFNNYAETADNFVSGSLDCFAYTAGTEVPLILEMEKHTDVLILALDKNVLDLLAKKFKTGTYVIKAGDYKSVTAPITTLGDYTCIVVRKDFPDSLVFAINKALWEKRKDVADIISDFGAISPNTALSEGLPTHPASVRFWKELNKNK